MNLFLASMAAVGLIEIERYEYWECSATVGENSYASYSATYDQAVDIAILDCTSAGNSQADCKAGLQCERIEEQTAKL